jgi:gluconolactonase
MLNLGLIRDWRRGARGRWSFGEATALACLLASAAVGCSSHETQSTRDASSPDAAARDAGHSDAGHSDAGRSDAGASTGTGYPPLDFHAIGKATQISGQFYFSEGPVWDPKAGVLYFTDINAPQGGKTGGAIYRLTLPDALEIVLQPAGNADGLALDPQGNLVAAGFFSRNVWRLSDDQMQTLSPCASPDTVTCYGDKPINTPDDVTYRSDGVLYFSDPTFASGAQGFPKLDLPLQGAQGVYRLTTDGVLHLEDSSTSGPNGVNLSPDETILYVSYTSSSSVSRFDVAPDGSLSNKRPFASGAAVADSMCVDAGGNVYVATLSGLNVYDATGTLLGTIAAGGIVTNCAFGGPDQKTLFITSRGQQSLIGTPVANDSYLYSIENMPIPGIAGQN